jgi:phospholipase D1/2
VPTGRVPSETGDESAPHDPKLKDVDVAPWTSKDYVEGIPSSEQTFFSKLQSEGQRPQPLRNTKHAEPFEPWEREAMEKLLGEVNGHLGLSDQQSGLTLLIFSLIVLYPTKFLEAEDDADNFLFNADR